jgi:alanyl-tRNA synthetase
MNGQINSNTVVLFPRGVTEHTSKVIAAQWYREEERVSAVITEETPFHPIDHKWPDQPGDTGTISIGGSSFAVLDSIVAGCAEGTNELRFASDLPKRSAPGWWWCVAHLVLLESGEPRDLLHQRAGLSVDAEKRLRLSAGHTASHLFSFAFNMHTRRFWRGPAPKLDSVGNPNLDQLAIESSRIRPNQSLDHYRFGKTLSKSGFESAAFLSALEATADDINRTVQEWIGRGGPVAIDCTSPTLDARREWTCNLPIGPARMLCGGTHITDLSQLRSATLRVERVPDVAEIRAHMNADLASNNDFPR